MRAHENAKALGALAEHKRLFVTSSCTTGPSTQRFLPPRDHAGHDGLIRADLAPFPVRPMAGIGKLVGPHVVLAGRQSGWTTAAMVRAA